jgi:hypothetical protein
MIYDYKKASIGDIKQLATSRGLKIHTLSPEEDLKTSEMMIKMYQYNGRRSTNTSSGFFSVFEYGKDLGDGMRVSTPIQLLTRPYYALMQSCTTENIVTNFHYISGPYVSSILYGYTGNTLPVALRSYKMARLLKQKEPMVEFSGSSSLFFVTDKHGYPYLFLGRKYGHGHAMNKKTVQNLCQYADSMGCGILLGANHGLPVNGTAYSEEIYTPRHVTRAQSPLGGFTSNAEYYDNMVPKAIRVVVGENYRNVYRFHVKCCNSHTTRVLFKAKNPISSLSFDQQNKEFAQYDRQLKELVAA